MNLACPALLKSSDLASVSTIGATVHYCDATWLGTTCLFLLLQEGPHSALNEDEFFDALEMAYQQDEMV